MKEVNRAEENLRHRRTNLANMTEAFQRHKEREVLIGKISGSFVAVPKHLLQPFEVLMLIYLEEQVGLAERELETVAHALVADS